MKGADMVIVNKLDIMGGMDEVNKIWALFILFLPLVFP